MLSLYDVLSLRAESINYACMNVQYTGQISKTS